MYDPSIDMVEVTCFTIQITVKEGDFLPWPCPIYTFDRQQLLMFNNNTTPKEKIQWLKKVAFAGQ